MTTIDIQLSATRKEKPKEDQLAFGRNFTDHMFIMDYSTEKGWYDPRIVPYAPISLDPSTMVFHYGQTVFEGLKAYRTKDDQILLFRPEKNMERMNLSNERICIPHIDGEIVIEGLKKLIQVDRDWVPTTEGTSLYIRPFVIPTEPFLGVAPATQYRFMIIMSPVGSYYKEGIQPVRIFVENEYVRAVAGGTGTAKTGGNYAASLKAQEEATKRGYTQVLWLDGVEKKYVEEVGSMNVFFKIKGEVVTPQLNGSILEGITRNSILQLLRHWNIPVSERRISMDEIREAYDKGELEEAFGTGTAAVISPIGEFLYEEKQILINEGKTGELSKKLYDTLTGIQNGTLKDEFGWTVTVENEKVLSK
ncbi:branched-chain amino acid aminotransferase [Metabacillus fastidiosus]|uniref:branched-chain amino acid aminotransferase n=1 Tax=Metabacillus fastidiosus TaxID=1458 RepID=UPI002DBAED7E|nr:branched-chain amino acid aminotransferase [Metabacillus fastidiosus]MEC2074857.1 branched-chain amino acid aminotransferase [Metabacillus fastidiosus]